VLLFNGNKQEDDDLLIGCVYLQGIMVIMARRQSFVSFVSELVYFDLRFKFNCRAIVKEQDSPWSTKQKKQEAYHWVR